MKTLIQNLSFIVISFVCFSLAIETKAQQTKKISMQGFLKDANGKAVADGAQDMIFKLYTEDAGGTAEWTESQTINVFGGVYSTHLGKTVPLDNLNWGAKTYYVGVTVQGTELTPRTELTFAPYSLGSPKAQEVVCSGAVGDIKHSILSPLQFRQVNGDCWVPMDGSSMAGSKLAVILGISTLPDGSGVFIRSQEFENKAERDPNRAFNSTIATLQGDDLGSHAHSASLSVSGSTGSDGNHSHTFWIGKNGFDANGGRATVEHVGTNSGDVSGAASPINTQNSGSHAHSISGTASGNTGNAGGNETRPKNLNFWVYIRIN